MDLYRGPYTLHFRRESPTAIFFPDARKEYGKKGAAKGDTFDCVPLDNPPAPTAGGRLPPPATPAEVSRPHSDDVCCRGQSHETAAFRTIV